MSPYQRGNRCGDFGGPQTLSPKPIILCDCQLLIMTVSKLSNAQVVIHGMGVYESRGTPSIVGFPDNMDPRPQFRGKTPPHVEILPQPGNARIQGLGFRV